MKNSLKRFTAVLACTALTAALALPARAAEDQPIRVGSYKGTTLEVGERSGLVIGPGGPAYTVTSSDPDTVEVEQVMNFWTAVAKAEGSAEITVSNQTGETATLTLTVGSHAPQAPTVESIDETALSYAEIKALCTGNPHIKEKMDLDIDVQRLRLLKANHLSQRYALEDQIIKTLPQQIAKYEQSIEGYLSDMDRLKENTHPNEDGFSPMEVEGTVYTDKKAAGSAILAACKAMTSPEPVPLGQYRGFSMDLSFASLTREFKVTLKGALYYTTNLGTDVFGNILRLDNLLESMEERISTCREQLENTRMQLENAKLEVDKPFPQEDELKRKSARLDELNILLNMDKRESEIVDGDVGDEVTAPARGSPDRER